MKLNRPQIGMIDYRRMALVLTSLFFTFLCLTVFVSDIVLVHFWAFNAFRHGATIDLLIYTFIFLLAYTIGSTITFYFITKTLLKSAC